VQCARGKAEAGEDDRDEVGRARHQEEGDRPAADPLRGHPHPPQRPRTERETSRAAGRQEHVGRLLGHRDLVAEPPGKTPREDAAECRDEAEARAELERQGEPDQGRVGVGEPRAQLAEAGNGKDCAGDERREDGDLDRPAPALKPGGRRIGCVDTSGLRLVHVLSLVDHRFPFRETGHFRGPAAARGSSAVRSTSGFASIGSPEKGGGPTLSDSFFGTLEVRGR